MKRQITLTLLPISLIIFFLTFGHITTAAPGELDAPLGNSDAATITVTNTNDSGAGSLRQAIADAAPGDTINFGVNGTITLTSYWLLIDKNLTIQGPGANLLSISGGQSWGVFAIYGGTTVTLDGMTITNGRSLGAGGGIYNGGTLTVSNSIINGNLADSAGGTYDAWGGGIFNTGALTVTHSTISGNSADQGGGGIANGYAGTLTVSNSTISGNDGGIYSSGTLVVNSSTIADNTGGGIFVGGDSTEHGITLDLNGSTVSGNTGDGIAVFDSSVAVSNSTISGNSGNGINITNSTLIGETLAVTSSTISGNTIRGLYCRSAGLFLANTIVGNNTDGDMDANAYCYLGSARHNLIGDSGSSGGIQNGVNGNIVGVNPLLGPLQNDGGPTMTHALLTGSPAINAGNNCVLTTNGCGFAHPALPMDQRGMPRNGPVDIGAFELQGGPFPTPTPNITPTPPQTPTPTPNLSLCTPSLTVTEVYPGSLNGFTAITAGQNSVTVDIADGGIGLQGFSVVSSTNANVSIPSFPQGTHSPVTATFTITSQGQPVDFTLRAGARSSAVLIRAQCAGGPAPTPTPVITPTPPPPSPTPVVTPTPPPSPTPNVTPTPAPSPTPGGTCTPSLTVTEVFPGSAGAFESITAGPGSVTVDIADSGIGLQSITLQEAANASVAIPSFAAGTYQPVTTTFSVQNAGQPVDFTLRASARLNSVLIRGHCGSAAARNDASSTGLPDTSFWLPTPIAFIEDLFRAVFEPQQTNPASPAGYFRSSAS